MNQSDKVKERVLKKAAELGMNLTIINEPSGKVYFPEKLERANKILADGNFTLVKIGKSKK